MTTGCAPNPPKPLSSTTLSEGPWHDLAVYLLRSLPSGLDISCCGLLYSRYYEYTLMTSTTTVKVIDDLEIFSRHGHSITIKSDNGPQFTSGEVLITSPLTKALPNCFLIGRREGSCQSCMLIDLSTLGTPSPDQDGIVVPTTVPSQA